MYTSQPVTFRLTSFELAKVSIMDAEGKTPLHVAAAVGNLAAVKELVLLGVARMHE
jgi:ankyrin repeat protein